MDIPQLRYEQLAGELAGMISGQILRPGERLPSVRRLAGEKRLSISTVVQAMRQLEDRGLIEARPQSGFFVRHPAPRLAELSTQKPSTKPVSVGISQRLVSVLQFGARRDVMPLGCALPDPVLLPVAALNRLYSRLARTRPALLAAGSHADMNAPELVRQLVRRSLAWGGPLAANELVITNSCTEAILLCLRAVTRPGDTVAVESPTYHLMLQAIEELGLKALEVPTNPRTGMSIDALELATRKGGVAACLLSPNVLNPSGAIMPDEHKQRLAALTAERDIPVIEDDIYGDLHFEGQRPWPLKAFDRAGNVLLCSSFSKTLTPALRCGFVAAGSYQAKVTLQKTIVSGGTNLLTQHVLAAYLESGVYERHLRGLRRMLQQQIARVGDAVLRHFPPGTRVAQPQGGMVLWVELPGNASSQELHDMARAENIAFVPGDLFSASGLYRNCLRLNCGNVWSGRLEAGVIRLGQLAAQLKTSE